MSRQQVELLDCAFKLLDTAVSPQDFTLILQFDEPPDLGRLHAGAKSASEHYGVAAKSETPIGLEDFVNERFDLHLDYPIKQALIGATLATRFHHAAADGLSAALWLGHQLSVAYRLIPTAHAAEVSLRPAETSVRRSQFAYDGACDPLWIPANSKRTGTRRWTTFSFAATELRQACRQAGGFTYSDLLATCALEVFGEWNQRHDRNGHGRNGVSRVGLWLPMNIRSRSHEGFGNGTSRIRLYARYAATASLVDKTREVRKQVSWSTEHGEWAVPELPLLTRLPARITAPLLKRYLNRASVDMATGVFSHADRWAGDARDAFKQVKGIECVGLLHPRQNLAINAATHQGQTWMTFTYDTGLLRAGDVEGLVDMYQHQIAVARKELL